MPFGRCPARFPIQTDPFRIEATSPRLERPRHPIVASKVGILNRHFWALQPSNSPLFQPAWLFHHLDLRPKGTPPPEPPDPPPRSSAAPRPKGWLSPRCRPQAGGRQIPPARPGKAAKGGARSAGLGLFPSFFFAFPCRGRGDCSACVMCFWAEILRGRSLAKVRCLPGCFWRHKQDKKACQRTIHRP